MVKIPRGHAKSKPKSKSSNLNTKYLVFDRNLLKSAKKCLIYILLFMQIIIISAFLAKFGKKCFKEQEEDFCGRAGKSAVLVRPWAECARPSERGRGGGDFAEAENRSGMWRRWRWWWWGCWRRTAGAASTARHSLKSALPSYQTITNVASDLRLAPRRDEWGRRLFEWWFGSCLPPQPPHSTSGHSQVGLCAPPRRMVLACVGRSTGVGHSDGWCARGPTLIHPLAAELLLLRIRLAENQLYMLCVCLLANEKQAPCEIRGQNCYVIGATWVKGLLQSASSTWKQLFWFHTPSDSFEID